MSDMVSFAEMYGQRVELLPSRTLLQTTAGIDGDVHISGSTIDDDTIDLDGDGIDDVTGGSIW
ncbi:MAG: hypothetical protein ACRDTF_15400 [Pseudonocardiaceae bacterium]